MTMVKLRSLMAQGVNPFFVLDDSGMLQIAEEAIVNVERHGWDGLWREAQNLWAGRCLAEGKTMEAQLLLWGTEIAEDPEVRTWVISLLPAELVACEELMADMDRRQFAIEGDFGPFTCQACGQARVERFVRIVDRAGTIEDLAPDDLVFCADCLRITRPGSPRLAPA